MLRRIAPLLIALAALLAPAAALAQSPAAMGQASAPAAQGAVPPKSGNEQSKIDPPAAGGAGDEEDGSEDAENRINSTKDKTAYQVSAGGHRYRVKFDPASRVTITAAATVLHDGKGNALPTFETGFSLGYRRIYSSGEGDGRVFWQVDHQLTSGTVRPFLRPAGDIPSFDATLYRATLLRHTGTPSIVLPMSPPVTIGFPFDVGLDIELGRVALPVTPVVLPGFSKPAPWLHLGVARTSFTLDPWRTGQPGRSLALGVGVRYDVDVYAAPTLEKPRFVHRVAPMTSGSVRFRYQSDDGLLSLDLFGEAAPHWTSDNTWAFLANASARVDRTLIAINDRPIGAYAEVAYRYLPEGLGAPALHDVHGTVGIAASLSLK